MFLLLNVLVSKTLTRTNTTHTHTHVHTHIQFKLVREILTRDPSDMIIRTDILCLGSL